MIYLCRFLLSLTMVVMGSTQVYATGLADIVVGSSNTNSMSDKYTNENLSRFSVSINLDKENPFATVLRDFPRQDPRQLLIRDLDYSNRMLSFNMVEPTDPKAKVGMIFFVNTGTVDIDINRLDVSSKPQKDLRDFLVAENENVLSRLGISKEYLSRLLTDYFKNHSKPKGALKSMLYEDVGQSVKIDFENEALTINSFEIDGSGKPLQYNFKITGVTVDSTLLEFVISIDQLNKSGVRTGRSLTLNINFAGYGRFETVGMSQKLETVAEGIDLHPRNIKQKNWMAKGMGPFMRKLSQQCKANL